MRHPVTQTPTSHPIRLLIAAACALALCGCASKKGEPTTQFDFGPALSAAVAPATPAAQASPLGAVVITDVTGSSALDNERMFYRLSYADAQEARSYANSRWSASPLQLLTQRLKTRIGQAGAKVLSETDASAGIPILRVDVDDFIQDFSGAGQSSGVVAVRASVFQVHALVDQKTFVRRTSATSADAPGGARALAASTDGVAADIAAWLGTLNLARR